MKIILLGYMGSGKSSVGKRLANKLKYSFIDLDSQIENKTEMSIAEIFQVKGEIWFRNYEKQALDELLERDEAMVISLGGGTPCYGTVMEELLLHPNNMTVYLKTDLDILTDRLWPEMESRPLISHLQTKESLKDFIRKHLFERFPYYSQAKLTVENNADMASTVEKIVSRLF
ncbi:AAA family ATPase [Flavobacteriaceae bacterium TK19130]|nr:AAA family ATPase [Thermobacterium salinum]